MKQVACGGFHSGGPSDAGPAPFATNASGRYKELVYGTENGMVGQLLLDYTSLNVLFFISAGATTTACLLSLGLPSPRPRKAATALGWL